MRTPEQQNFVNGILATLKRPYRCKVMNSIPNNIQQGWLSVLERKNFLFVANETVLELNEYFIKDFVRDNFLTIRSVKEGVVISKN